jgi:hypothetical protein
MAPEILHICEFAGSDAECERVEVPSWQPIDTAPCMRNVLLAHGQSVTVGLRYTVGGLWHDSLDEDGFTYSQPTHWMPLPRAPLPDAERSRPHE